LIDVGSFRGIGSSLATIRNFFTSIDCTAEGIEIVVKAAHMTALGCGELPGYLSGLPAVPRTFETMDRKN